MALSAADFKPTTKMFLVHPSAAVAVVEGDVVGLYESSAINVTVFGDSIPRTELPALITSRISAENAATNSEGSRPVGVAAAGAAPGELVEVITYGLATVATGIVPAGSTHGRTPLYLRRNILANAAGGLTEDNNSEGYRVGYLYAETSAAAVNVIFVNCGGGEKDRRTFDITVASGTLTNNAAHNLSTTPSRIFVTPTADVGLDNTAADVVSNRWWATANSTTVTITLSDTVPGNVLFHVEVIA